MLFLVIERFKHGDAVPVYRRFREQGRMAPDGVVYIDSWVTSDLRSCYQIMQAPDRARLQGWIERWQDLVDFEVHEVMSSPEAFAAIAPRL